MTAKDLVKTFLASVWLITNAISSTTDKNVHVKSLEDDTASILSLHRYQNGTYLSYDHGFKTFLVPDEPFVKNQRLFLYRPLITTGNIRNVVRFEIAADWYVAVLTSQNIFLFKEIENHEFQTLGTFSFSLTYPDSNQSQMRLTRPKIIDKDNFELFVLIGNQFWLFQNTISSASFFRQEITNFAPMGDIHNPTLRVADAFFFQDGSFALIQGQNLIIFKNGAEVTRITMPSDKRVQNMYIIEEIIFVLTREELLTFEYKNSVLSHSRTFQNFGLRAQSRITAIEDDENIDKIFLLRNRWNNAKLDFYIFDKKTKNLQIIKKGFKLVFQKDLLFGKISKNKIWISDGFILFELDLNTFRITKFLKGCVNTIRSSYKRKLGKIAIDFPAMGLYEFETASGTFSPLFKYEGRFIRVGSEAANSGLYFSKEDGKLWRLAEENLPSSPNLELVDELDQLPGFFEDVELDASKKNLIFLYSFPIEAKYEIIIYNLVTKIYRKFPISSLINEPLSLSVCNEYILISDSLQVYSLKINNGQVKTHPIGSIYKLYVHDAETCQLFVHNWSDIRAGSFDGNNLGSSEILFTGGSVTAQRIVGDEENFGLFGMSVVRFEQNPWKTVKFVGVSWAREFSAAVDRNVGFWGIGMDLTRKFVTFESLPSCSIENCILCGSGDESLACKICNPNFDIFEGKCKEKCPKNKFLPKGAFSCEECPKDCTECSLKNEKVECISCKEKFYLLDNKCFSNSCQKNFIYKKDEENFYRCESCEEGCEECKEGKKNVINAIQVTISNQKNVTKKKRVY